MRAVAVTALAFPIRNPCWLNEYLWVLKTACSVRSLMFPRLAQAPRTMRKPVWALLSAARSSLKASSRDHSGLSLA